MRGLTTHVKKAKKERDKIIKSTTTSSEQKKKARADERDYLSYKQRGLMMRVHEHEMLHGERMTRFFFKKEKAFRKATEMTHVCDENGDRIAWTKNSRKAFESVFTRYWGPPNGIFRKRPINRDKLKHIMRGVRKFIADNPQHELDDDDINSPD